MANSSYVLILYMYVLVMLGSCFHCYLSKMRFIFRLAWRRGAVFCDESTILNRNLIGYGSGWTANCYNASCGSRTIGYTYFYCTDYSVNEDWSMGENNFTYTFPSYDKAWVVRYGPFIDFFS